MQQLLSICLEVCTITTLNVDFCHIEASITFKTHSINLHIVTINGKSLLKKEMQYDCEGLNLLANMFNTHI